MFDKILAEGIVAHKRGILFGNRYAGSSLTARSDGIFHLLRLVVR